MSKLLADKEEYQLYNITEDSDVASVIRKNDGSISEWVIPKKRKQGKLPHKIQLLISSLIEEIAPDIIHVWGTELLLGIIPLKFNNNDRLLLDMQGVLSSCYDAYMGDLHFEDFWHSQPWLHALYSFSFIKIQKYRMWKRINNERYILRNYPNISVQSKWVENRVLLYGPHANIFHSPISLRDEFIKNAGCWNYDTPKQIITIGSEQAYKGIHVTIKAFRIIKKTYPNIVLKIVGNYNFKKGYGMYLLDLIKHEGVEGSVIFTGSLNEREMIDELTNSACCINSSFVESYSLVLAEAMIIGVPCVVSYSGAMVELGDNKSLSFYTPNDFIQCATKALEIMNSKDIAMKMSEESVKLAVKRNGSESAIEQQLSIYNSLLK